MSTPVRKIVIKNSHLVDRNRGTKGDNGNAAYMARRREERAERRLMFSLLIKWERGFSMEDAPPACNEWTRAQACGTIGSR